MKKFYYVIVVLIIIGFATYSSFINSKTKVKIETIEDMREMAGNVMLDPTYELPEGYTFKNADEKKDYVRIIITKSTFFEKLSITFERALNEDEIRLIEIKENYFIRQVIIFTILMTGLDVLIGLLYYQKKEKYY